MAQHIDLVAILIAIYGVFQLGIACLVGLIYGGMGSGVALVGALEGEIGALIGGGVFIVFAVFIGLLLLIQPILAFFAASGLRRRTQMGRILAFIVAALAVMNMPIGTIVGIFTFVVLIDKEAAAEFSNEGRAEYFT
ncbi:MAG: hypothetical protein EP330_28190 [Deltaproteobacteria bacterium]|nr:MAG: hypothetical protein EP330_28190 [Deltaproteobacteria bacterium]